jgi:NADPH2:quinone reductase
MRAIQVSQFGGPDVLVAGDAPDPIAGPGQVIVDVIIADTLFVETQIRTGWGGEFFNVKPPYVPGFGVAGEVRSVGPGVEPGWIGRKIIGRTEKNGGYAEQAVVAADGLIPVPDGLGLREAAALLSDGPTALGLADRAAIKPGQWVLVMAAGGGLGILLIQLARAAGARVIAAARGARKLALARELGADVVVDYSDAGWLARVREATDGRGVDVVFDGAGGETGRAAFDIVADGGQFSAHGAPSGGFTAIDREEAARRGVTVRGIEQVQFAPADLKKLVERVLSEAAAGRIRPVIGQTFPLERAADAHAAIESRDVLGKTLLLTR